MRIFMQTVEELQPPLLAKLHKLALLSNRLIPNTDKPPEFPLQFYRLLSILREPLP